jgi:hypothetical protein
VSVALAAHHDPARSFRQAPKIVNEAFEGVPRAVEGKPLPLQFEFYFHVLPGF